MVITLGVKEVIVGYVSTPTLEIDPPKGTEVLLMVMALFCSCELVKPVPKPETLAGRVTVFALISKVGEIFPPVTASSAIFVDVTALEAN